LGLSPDGLYLLYRSVHEEAAGTSNLKVAPVDGGTAIEIDLPAGAQAAWGASSSALVRVSYADSGSTIWRLALELR
jgi:hypothetical protein